MAAHRIPVGNPLLDPKVHLSTLGFSDGFAISVSFSMPEKSSDIVKPRPLATVKTVWTVKLRSPRSIPPI